MCSASAASCTCWVSRRRPEERTRSSTSWVPVSWKGMRPASTASCVAGTRSTPITSSPLSANDRARGRPTRPRPITATLITRMSLRRCCPLAEDLAGDGRHEARVVVEVARQEPARLLGDAVGPLEPSLLHPVGRLRNPSRVEIEGSADAAHHRHLEAFAHPGHPLLLLRHPDADPEHVRPGLVDLLDDRVLLLAREFAERRGVAAHHVDARMLAAHGEGELYQRALIAAAVEPDAVPALSAAIVVAAH